MSQEERNRGYPLDPSEPSTSSGYRRPKPYDRKDSTDSEHLRKGTIKSIRYDDYSVAIPSTSRQHDESMLLSPSEIKTETKVKSEEVESTHSRRKMEPVFVSKPSTLVSKQGRSGRPVMLRSNHFKLFTVPNWCVYQYRIDFEPDESRTFIRKGMLKFHKDKVGPYIFDGTILYSSTRFSDKMELMSIRQSDNVPFKIIICLVGQLLPDDPHYNVIFNIIMRKNLEHLNLQLVGREYYDANNKINVPKFKLELWPGYITSIRQHERSILLNAEITHKVMRQETLLHILMDCYKRSNNYKVEFCNSVIGITVLTDYNNHTYRIEDVDFETKPSSTFPMKNGQHITYQEYYKNKYKIYISSDSQPMLVTRTKLKQRNAGQGELVYLVPELCRATGLNDNMRENFQLMKELSHHTCIAPHSRIDKLMKFNNRLRQEPKVLQEFKDWNMTLDKNLLEVPGRTLNAERLLFGDNKYITANTGDWTRDMQRTRLLRSTELRHWVVFGTGRDPRAVEEFVRTLQNVSYGIAFKVDRPQIQMLRDDKASTYVENLEYLLSKSNPDLVFCIVSNNRSDRYAAIKKKCCVDRPVPSQVFLQKNLHGRNTMTIATKVAIQMNCKLGGAPWNIENPLKGLMVIGFDICHDANTKGKDFLSMVATVDHSLTRYFSCINLYHSHEDLGDQLAMSVSKALTAYRKNTNAFPTHIFIYRDGVSDGQIRQVYENEVKKLEKKLQECYFGPNFKMIFIIVTKKINIRLFEPNRGNPAIGTIVDDVITNPLRYDFFIVSQQVRQGTISPTSYNVIFDNTNLQPDIVQLVTYKLTHMYYNCSSTVRVPASCHYAHKLSFLIGRFLHRPPNSQLENQLFFL